MGGLFDVMGNTHLRQNFSVNGDAQLKGTLHVAGDTFFKQNIVADGSVEMHGGWT
jgi:cytoskeletal protein CcmA (bactofilin family)